METSTKRTALHALALWGVGVIQHHEKEGPGDTSQIDPGLARKLAGFAGAVAVRYPWLEYYTPVNEPQAMTRQGASLDDRRFVLALLNQCRAVVLAMRAIRAVTRDAKLVQTDELGKTYGTSEMAALVDFFNQRRWLTWDLLCGKVGPGHPLWDYLTDSGADPADILWFRDNPCPPDIIGVHFDAASERWLDHRAERYPAQYRRVYCGQYHADIDSAHLARPTSGIRALLRETRQRYGLPVALTETDGDSIGCSSRHTMSVPSLRMQSWWPSGHSRWRQGEHSSRSDSDLAMLENGGA